MPMTSAERSRKWRLSHVVEKKLMDAGWVERNPERVRAIRYAYYVRNREAINARRRARRAAQKAAGVPHDARN
jgi:hypothetical protein